MVHASPPDMAVPPDRRTPRRPAAGAGADSARAWTVTEMRESLWFVQTRHGPFELALGTGAVVAATLAAATMLPPEQALARLIVMAVAVGICAAVLSRAHVAAAVSGLGYLLFTGFLVNSSGQLTVEQLIGDGQFFALALATVLGVGYRRLRTVQTDALIDAELRDLLDSVGQNGSEGERPHD